MHDVIADATHDGTTHRAEATSTHHNHWTLLLSRYVGNHLAGLPAEHGFNLPSQLQPVEPADHINAIHTANTVISTDVTGSESHGIRNFF